MLGNIIKEMNKIRTDLHWTILSPELIPSLEFDNTEQLIVPQVSYPNSMRMSFPFKEVFKAINWKHNDYDIVYSHLPEHTGNLKSLLLNGTNITPEEIVHQIQEKNDISIVTYWKNHSHNMSIQEINHIHIFIQN